MQIIKRRYIYEYIDIHARAGYFTKARSAPILRRSTEGGNEIRKTSRLIIVIFYITMHEVNVRTHRAGNDRILASYCSSGRKSASSVVCVPWYTGLVSLEQCLVAAVIRRVQNFASPLSQPSG